MSAITTHVLDTSLGKPGRGIDVFLERRVALKWRDLAKGMTDDNGRVANLLAEDHELVIGDYRLTFKTEVYFKNQGRPSFYPDVTIAFRVENPQEHYHVPLLLSSFGYTTYRGS